MTCDIREYFQKNFTGAEYKEEVIKRFDENHYLHLEQKFLFKSAVEFAQEHNFGGSSLLDIGTGSTLFSVLAVATQFEEIVLSELVDDCRHELQKWFSNDPGALDYSILHQNAADLLGYKNDDDARHKIDCLIRHKVKAIIPCDVLSEKIIATDYTGPYDGVTATLVMEPACPDYDSYKRSLKNINKLIRIGGQLLLRGFIPVVSWTCLGKWFPSLPLEKEAIQSGLEEAGFSNIIWKTLPKQKEYGCHFKFCYALLCKKTKES